MANNIEEIITTLYEMGYIYDSQDDPETEEVEEKSEKSKL